MQKSNFIFTLVLSLYLLLIFLWQASSAGEHREPLNKGSINKINPILVAVIDTGLDAQATQLKKFVWKNPGESGRDKSGNAKESNGIDDDNNGYIDDVSGWNFFDQSNSTADHHGHGTHISDLITKNNNPKYLKIIPLKYFDNQSRNRPNPLASFPHMAPAKIKNTLQTSLEALKYAISIPVNIINYSGGGTSFSQEEYNLLKKAEEKGILVIAAAGNDGENLHTHPYYPASYNLPNVVIVSSVDNKGNLSKFSNYVPDDQRSVKVNGEKILALGLQGKPVEMSGTSQSTAKFTSHLSKLLYFSVYSFKLIAKKDMGNQLGYP